MATIRIPSTAEPLLPYCRNAATCREDACFSNFAEMLVFAASLGFKRHPGKPPEPKAFLSQPYPVDLNIFKNQQLFSLILLIGLATAESHAIAQDEEKLCRMLEAYADVGLGELVRLLRENTAEDFVFTLARLCSETPVHATS